MGSRTPRTGAATLSTGGGGTSLPDSIKGDYDAATNTPDLDTSPSGILKGDSWQVSVAGNFFTEAVDPGDILQARQDDPTILAHWRRVQANVSIATESVEGLVEISTQAETDAGIDDSRSITPLKAQNGPKVANGAAGTDRIMRYETAGSRRWQIFANSDAESGLDNGSNLDICSYDDSGSFIGCAIRIDRDDLAALFNGPTSTFLGRIQFTGTNHSGIRLIPLTTTERDALTAVAGDIIFNETVGTIQGFNGTAWVDALVPSIASDFAFAYDTTPQVIGTANTFQGLTFNNNGQLDGWTHVTGTNVFGCTRTGKYKAAIRAKTQKTGGSVTAAIRALFNAAEIAGSHFSRAINTSNAADELDTDFEFDATDGQDLTIEFAGSTTNVTTVTGPDPGTAGTLISAQITIQRVT